MRGVTLAERLAAYSLKEEPMTTQRCPIAYVRAEGEVIRCERDDRHKGQHMATFNERDTAEGGSVTTGFTWPQLRLVPPVAVSRWRLRWWRLRARVRHLVEAE